MDNYEINDETLAIMPIGEKKSCIYEVDSTFEVNQNATKIMEESCRYFGSSLDGRRKGTQSLIGVSYKAPIIVEESNEIIFFPMASSRYQDPPWIGLKHLKCYYRTEDGIIIEFQNGTKILLDMSFGIVDNQILRATRLESALRGRKIGKKRLKM